MLFAQLTSRNTVPLADHSLHAGTFKSFCVGLLEVVERLHSKVTYVYDKVRTLWLTNKSIGDHHFHVLVNKPKDTLYLCVTPTDYDNRVAFRYEVGFALTRSFLQELMLQFEYEFDATISMFNSNPDFKPLPCTYKYFFHGNNSR